MTMDRIAQMLNATNDNVADGEEGSTKKKRATGKLKGKAARDAFVENLRGSQIQSHLEFPNVSNTWMEQTVDMADFVETLAKNQERNHNCQVEPKSIVPCFDQGGLSIDLNQTDHGGKYQLSDTASIQFLQRIGLPTDFLKTCGQKPVGEMDVDLERADWNEILFRRWQAYCNWDGRKNVYLRLRDGGSSDEIGICRAMLSEKYGVVNSAWMVGVVADCLGDKFGEVRVSHFNEKQYDSNGGDHLRCNLLFPQSTIDVDGGSQFSGLLGLNNNEVGGGGYSLLPGLYSYICANGIVWDHVADENFLVKGKHLGQIDSAKLADEIRTCLEHSLGIESQGLVERYNSLIDLSVGELNEQHLLAYVLKSHLGVANLTIAERCGIFAAMAAEECEVGVATGTARALVDAVTRYAHSDLVTSTARASELEAAAGGLVERYQSRDAWEVTLAAADRYNADSDFVRMANYAAKLTAA